MSALPAKIILLISSLVIALITLHLKPDKNPETVMLELPKQALATTTAQAKPETRATSSPGTAVKKKPETEAVKTSPPAQAETRIERELIPLETLDKNARKAVVNIFCTTKSGGDFRPISGSGVIIDPRGVILTNAHVAQYLLIKDYLTKDFATCIARGGSPAVPAYKIDLLYLPDNWMAQNIQTMRLENPEGTGENDYALLMITGSASSNPLPNPFPFIGIDTDQKDMVINAPMLLAGYPAGFLGGVETNTDLWIITSPSLLTRVYYFSEKENFDAFSLGPNIVAQKGASGGAAINQWTGELQGILTTISGGQTTGERDLAAISLLHIERSFRKNTGRSLKEFLSGDLNQSLADFKEKNLPGLVKTITDELNK